MVTVSVCIPTYNRQNLLPWAIESVLQQTFQDWELVICDDGSTDQTPQIVAQYQQQPGGDRIRYVRHDRNIGKSNNMRSGFIAATGQYFIKFDDDDRLCPEFLAQTVGILQQNRELAFVGTDHWLIDIHNQRQPEASDRNSQAWGRMDLPPGEVEDLLKVVFVRQSFQVGATLFRRSALEAVDFMRANLGNCEDNDLLVRLALGGHRGYYLPQRLMEYRMHGEQAGLNRAIPYLEDKLRYLEFFQFDRGDLEQVRRSRLVETQGLLGLRLVERGQGSDRPRGRALLRQVQQTGGKTLGRKAWVGLMLSRLPQPLRRWAFWALRQGRGASDGDRIRRSG